MKVHASILLALFLSTFHTPAQENPRVGDGKDTVIRVLGQPQGEMQNIKKEVLYYKRGLVDLQLGIVEQVDVLTRVEYHALLREKAAREKAEQEKKEAERQAQIKKGREALIEILEDDVFESRPAAVRLRIWEVFKARYPDVSIDEESFARASMEVEEMQAQERVERDKKLQEEAAADPGPRPKISSKRIKKMKRAGTWKWESVDE